LKSTLEAQREAGIIATASLLTNDELAPHLLQMLAPLLHPTSWFGLSKDELGVLRTPIGKLYKQIQLDEYIPQVEQNKGKTRKDDDDFEAQKKAAELKKKHDAVIKEKLTKLEAEQTIVEAQLREKALQVYLPIHSALKVVLYG